MVVGVVEARVGRSSAAQVTGAVDHVGMVLAGRRVLVSAVGARGWVVVGVRVFGMRRMFGVRRVGGRRVFGVRLRRLFLFLGRSR